MIRFQPLLIMWVSVICDSLDMVMFLVLANCVAAVSATALPTAAGALAFNHRCRVSQPSKADSKRRKP